MTDEEETFGDQLGKFLCDVADTIARAGVGLLNIIEDELDKDE